MSSKTESFEYTGSQELAVMELAKNYNHSILSSVIHAYRSIAQASTTLDFGAGNGFFADAFQSATGSQVYCVEPDLRLRKTIESRNQELKTLEDLKQLGPQKVDFIYSLNVLEHIEDDLQALREIKEVLQEEGKLYLYVPAFQLLYTSNDRLVGHHRRYAKADLVTKLEQAGFKIISVKYRDQVGFFATLVYKLFLDNGSGAIGVRSLIFFDRFLFPLNSVLGPLFGRVFGKNLEVVVGGANKPGGDPKQSAWQLY